MNRVYDCVLTESGGTISTNRAQALPQASNQFRSHFSRIIIVFLAVYRAKPLV